LWEKSQRPRLWDFGATVTPHGTTYWLGDADRSFAEDANRPVG
jgi:hypothetical protein